MRGETITVLTREQTGTTELGEPLYEWTAQTVDNCLVKPASGADIDIAERPDGVEVRYTIAFPKTYAGPSLYRARVVLSDRAGAVVDANAAAETALRVTGDPDITRPCPTAWNMLVEVGVTRG